MKTRFIVKDILAPLRHLLKKMPEKNVVLILSLVVGIACGCAAVLLKSAVEFIHHGLISWFDSQAYNFLYLIYPGIGMLIAMLFVKYVIKDNMQYAENDTKLLSDWDMKELVAWDVPMAIKKGNDAEDVGEVEFTQVLDECHNYVVLYFDNEVDWLQAQTLLGIKPVRLKSTKKDGDNINGQKTGIGRVLRGVDVINRLLGENSPQPKTKKNKS